jgi:hypothetical protein
MKQATRSSPVQRSEPQNASPPFAPLLQIAYGATAAMLATITPVSLIVYEWVGFAFLRSGWVNLDLIWIAGLGFCGVLLMLA